MLNLFFRSSGLVGSLFLLLFLFTPRGVAQSPRVTPLPVDLSGNGIVDDGDVGMAVEAWTELRYQGFCASERYLFLEGAGTSCLEVADVQRLAAGWGRTPAGTQVESAEIMGPASVAATFVVNSTGDESDARPGDGVCETQVGNGTCTLRAAIEETNTRAGADSIHFDIRNPDGSCPALVRLEPANTPTRTLTLEDRTGGTTIDGYTQCGAAPNRQDRAGDAVIKIEIRGNDQDGVHGLQLKSAHNVVRGLALYNWDWQLAISGSAARYNRVQGNFLGTDAANRHRAAVERRTWHRYGVHIRAGASYNIVGCGAYDGNNQYLPCPGAADYNAARNIITGNGNDGLAITDEGTNYNRAVGNYIGLRQDGRNRPDTRYLKLGNSSDGVDINEGPQFNRIGGQHRPRGDHPGERNILSGNYEGIEISHASNTQNNSIVGNYIGLDAFGNATDQSINVQNGIALEDAVSYNLVMGNVIGNNGRNGIFLQRLIVSHQIESNLIGITPDGRPAPNGWDPNYTRNGIYGARGSAGNTLRWNTIANNPEHGIFFKDSGTTHNTFSENRIYHNGLRGIELIDGANQALPPPSIDRATTSEVAGRARVAGGSACAGCRIELFVTDKTTVEDPGGDNNGEGMIFIAAGMTDSAGRFSVAVSQLVAGQILSATSTDPNGNSSRFARNVAVEGGNSPPTPTPTPTPTATATPTPVATATPTATATPSLPWERVHSLPGRIQAEDYRPGGQGTGYYDTSSGNSGGVYREDDVDIQRCSDGSGCYNVGWIRQSEWLAYNVEFPRDGRYVFRVRSATPYSDRQLRIELDGRDVSGTIVLPLTEGWDSWSTVESAPVDIPAGSYTLRIVMLTSRFNLNYVEVVAR